MNIEKKLINIIREAYEKSKYKKNGFNDFAKSMQPVEQKPKPENSIIFKIIKIELLNLQLSQKIENYLRTFNLKFKKINNIYKLENVPADPIIIQLALNFPPEWIKISGSEDDNIIKNIKIKGNKSRATSLMDSLEDE